METLHALLTLTLCHCATDGSTEHDRGGPDALSGISWHTKLHQNSIDFDFSFMFDDTAVAAANTVARVVRR